MGNYFQINSYSDKNGELAVSREIFEDIVLKAVLRTVKENNKNLNCKVTKPVKVVFSKNGQLSIKVCISLKKCSNITNISLLIQKEIARDFGTGQVIGKGILNTSVIDYVSGKVTFLFIYKHKLLSSFGILFSLFNISIISL